MENLLDSLSGIDRVKYLKALIEKVNNIGSKYTTSTRTQPAKEESQICSACASKTKRFLLESSRNLDKIDLKRTKPISQKCDVHRLKFVRHQQNDSKTSALNVPKCEVKTHQRQTQTEKTLEAARDASFEAEKRYLRKIYLKKPTNEVDNHQPQPKPIQNLEIKKQYNDETQTDRASFCQMHSTNVDTRENIRPALEQSRPIIDAVLPQQSEPELTTSIVAERGGKLIGDGSVANRNRTIAVTNAQQSISDPLITMSSDGTRRIVSYTECFTDGYV